MLSSVVAMASNREMKTNSNFLPGLYHQRCCLGLLPVGIVFSVVSYLDDTNSNMHAFNHEVRKKKKRDEGAEEEPECLFN